MATELNPRLSQDKDNVFGHVNDVDQNSFETEDEMDMNIERPSNDDQENAESIPSTRSNKYSDSAYFDSLNWANADEYLSNMCSYLGIDYNTLKTLYEKFQKYQHVSGGTRQWGYENANAFIGYLYANYPEYTEGIDKFVNHYSTNYNINLGGWWNKYFNDLQNKSGDDNQNPDNGSDFDNQMNIYGYTNGEWSQLSSAEQTLAMEKYLDSISTNLFDMLMNQEGSLVGLGRALLGFYNTFGQLLQKSSTFGMSAGDSWNATSTIYSLASSIINNRLQMLYERENWLFQNEYNNPINSIKRLIDAGINPAYYFDSLDKSNAGSIGSPNIQTPSDSPVTGESANIKGLESANMAFGAVGSLGNLFNGAMSSLSGAVANSANAGYLGAMKDNVRTKTPLEAGNLIASINSLNSQTDTENQSREAKVASLWAQRNELLAHARNYQDVIDLQYKELDNAMAIAKLNNETAMYGVDVQSATQRFIASLQNQLGLKSLDVNSMLQILNYCEDIQEEEIYTDSETGSSISRSELLQQIEKDAQSASASASNGVIGGLFGVNAGVDVSSETSKMDNTQHGSTYSYGGKSYTKSRTTKRVFNPERYGTALFLEKMLLKGLRNGKVSPQEYCVGVSTARSIQERERKNVRKYAGNSLTNYAISWVKKLFNVGD